MASKKQAIYILPMASLTLLAQEPPLPLSKALPKVFVLHKPITRIGSDLSCDVVLNNSSDGCHSIEADHAHIVREGLHFIIATCSRRYSFILNGKKARRAKLCEADRIEIGSHTLSFSLHDQTSQSSQTSQTSQTSNPLTDGWSQLADFGQRLLDAGDSQELLIRLMDLLIEQTGASRGFLIWLRDGDPKVRIARDMARNNIDNAMDSLSDTVIQKVLREREPVLINHALQSEEFSASRSMHDLRLQSVICIPLAGHKDNPPQTSLAAPHKDELLGLIYLASNTVADLFDPKAAHTATLCAGMASLLLRNQMLVDTLRADNASLRKASQARQLGDLVGSSDAMQAIFETVRKVASTRASVLITGETGTGKELIARQVHLRSPRAKAPFVVVHCGAIPEALLESELFGHVQGAFTGASRDHLGKFCEAEGGTIFLDEIGEMPSQLQVKLLRVLQEREITPVGSTQTQAVDIRIVAATHQNLERRIQEGTFREDLYYRLNVVGIHLPPLRARGDDIMILARYLLQRCTAALGGHKTFDFSPQAAQSMLRYPWPGNVRQLENKIKRATIMSEHTCLSPEDLGLGFEEPVSILPLAQAKEAFAQKYIDDTLAQNNGNRTQAALQLGVDPRTIFRHLERKAQKNLHTEPQR